MLVDDFFFGEFPILNYCWLFVFLEVIEQKYIVFVFYVKTTFLVLQCYDTVYHLPEITSPKLQKLLFSTHYKGICGTSS